MIYTVSFNSKMHSAKPTKKEVARISSSLCSCGLTRDRMIEDIAHRGCTFAPAVFKDNKRNKEHFEAQQLFGLDFDDGITAAEVKERAERYRLPTLFAYKTFSWTPEKEKFRVVFAFDHVIRDRHTAECILKMLRFIFPESDKACTDVSRMFYGSNKGEIEGFRGSKEFSIDALDMAVYQYAVERYGKDHFKRTLTKLYGESGIAVGDDKKIYHKDEQGNVVINHSEKAVSKQRVPKCGSADGNTERRKLSNVDLDVLDKRCRLFHEFRTGKEYFYYPEMFILASNLVNVQRGRKKFMSIINSEVNDSCIAYRDRDWWTVTKYMIDRGYNPKRCDDSCPYASECPHCKNMILTASPGKTNIVPLKTKQYVSIEEAEQSLRENINKAINSAGINIIKAQTGLGKTHTYLRYIAESKNKFLVVVPTHKLADEICAKAKGMGIRDMLKVPELEGLSHWLTSKIEHIYATGAGAIGLKCLRNKLEAMPKTDPDYEVLLKYFAELDMAEHHAGNLVITHERFLNLYPNSEMLKDKKVIIDEDILRSMYATQCVSVNDVKLAVQRGIFDNREQQRIEEILQSEGFRYFSGGEAKYIDESLLEKTKDITGNVLDLLNARVLKNDGKNILYIRTRMFPCDDLTLLSATVDRILYEKMLGRKVNFYECKEAEYNGTVHVYSDSTYSRDALLSAENHQGRIRELKEKVKNDTVITFIAVEEEFDTKYHYGAVEGLNCLEGKNISVIGLPNINEDVYKLYGMLMGVNVTHELMARRKIQYKDHEFHINTYGNELLRRVQLWFLESQLEQAVGRARLLRYDCNVNVFARFPIEQGIYE